MNKGEWISLILHRVIILIGNEKGIIQIVRNLKMSHEFATYEIRNLRMCG